MLGPHCHGRVGEKMSCKFFSINTYDYLRNTCLHYIVGASSISPYVITIAWGIASGIIIHHWSGAYEFSIYWFSLIYFPAATVTITTKYQKHYFYYCYLLLPLALLLYYFATKHFAADTNFPGVVELTTQLLILENILWLPLCRINKFGLNTLPSKTVAILYTCGLSDPQVPAPQHFNIGPHGFFEWWLPS